MEFIKDNWTKLSKDDFIAEIKSWFEDTYEDCDDIKLGDKEEYLGHKNLIYAVNSKDWKFIAFTSVEGYEGSDFNDIQSIINYYSTKSPIKSWYSQDNVISEEGYPVWGGTKINDYDDAIIHSFHDGVSGGDDMIIMCGDNYSDKSQINQ
jgi:hypothetical protein